MKKKSLVLLVALITIFATACNKSNKKEEVKKDQKLSELFIEIPNSGVAGYEMSPGKNDLILINKDSSFNLNVLYTPDDVTNKKLQWVVSNNDIITVDNKGTVKALKVGETTLYAKSDGIKSNEITINVISDSNDE